MERGVILPGRELPRFKPVGELLVRHEGGFRLRRPGTHERNHADHSRESAARSVRRVARDTFPPEARGFRRSPTYVK